MFTWKRSSFCELPVCSPLRLPQLEDFTTAGFVCLPGLLETAPRLLPEPVPSWLCLCWDIPRIYSQDGDTALQDGEKQGHTCSLETPWTNAIMAPIRSQRTLCHKVSLGNYSPVAFLSKELFNLFPPHPWCQWRVSHGRGWNERIF